MKEILEHLYQHKTLSKAEAKEILLNITQGKYNSFQLASFLTAFMMRNITTQELKGFREALLELCIPVELEGIETIDLCGTGGDGKNTFNISTLASFVVAGAGIPVTKHGNYGVSSVSGSSNVLESLGISFTNNNDALQKQLETAHICFLHAPLFHPAMKYVAEVRKALGVKTFFNMLGPLVNPAKPSHQLVGVFNLELARTYQYVLQEELNNTFCILHATDGFDEVSLTADCKVITRNSEQIINADYFKFKPTTLEKLYGGETVEEAAVIFQQVLHGKGTQAQNEVVLANAALAVSTYTGKNIPESIEISKESLFGKKALQCFTKLRELNTQL
ncbi:MAG: anthranilate phosphoribosyltransferase [Luteibaculaceae bacterium]